MDEAPRGNPYAAPSARVADMGPPSRFLLTCVVALHGVWLVFCALVFLALLIKPIPGGRLLTFAVLAFTTLYGFTIVQLWRKRRWAWRVSWIPIVAALIVGLLGLFGMIISPDDGDPGTRWAWGILCVLLLPAFLVVPLQWMARREL